MHLISLEDICLEQIYQLFEKTKFWQKVKKDKIYNIPKPLDRKLITNLFYEPSTRTSSSFFSAASFLGASVNQINNVSFSSVSKGESFEDTIKTLSKYSDGIVLRHPKIGSAKIASEASEAPIINAGDGAGEHPTQTLLDLFTLDRELNGIDNKVIAMVGDLKNGRTIHSLSRALGLFSNINVILISPEELKLPNLYKSQNVKYFETNNSIEEVFSKFDIDAVYMTRIQKERFSNADEYLKLKGCYKLTKEHLLLLKKESCILHPLPRVDELSKEVDFDERAAYFRQVENGLFMRMAILETYIQ